VSAGTEIQAQGLVSQLFFVLWWKPLPNTLFADHRFEHGAEIGS
jgi:hypothetical protein